MHMAWLLWDICLYAFWIVVFAWWAVWITYHIYGIRMHKANKEKKLVKYTILYKKTEKIRKINDLLMWIGLAIGFCGFFVMLIADTVLKIR